MRAKSVDSPMLRAKSCISCTVTGKPHELIVATAASTVPASGLFPTLLPAVQFGGVDPAVRFHDFSPRLGMTYDLRGNGTTVAHANFARYYGQVGTGGVSSQINPITAVTVRSRKSRSCDTSSTVPG